MAEVTKTGTPSICTPYPAKEHLITGLIAGESLAAADAVYIKAADGLVWKATGAANDALARVVGFVTKAASVGEACTIAHHVNFAYGPNVSGTASAPGAPLFLSGTVAGGLADAASTGGLLAIAVVLDTDGRIWAKGNY